MSSWYNCSGVEIQEWNGDEGWLDSGANNSSQAQNQRTRHTYKSVALSHDSFIQA